jgi:hypothetical protein
VTNAAPDAHVCTLPRSPHTPNAQGEIVCPVRLASVRRSWRTSISTRSSSPPRSPEREFNRIRDEQGLKAAIAWRDARFRES